MSTIAPINIAGLIVDGNLTRTNSSGLPFTVTGNVQVDGTFTLQGATPLSAANVNVASGGNFELSGGKVAGSGSIIVAAGGTLTLDTGNTKTINVPVNNFGTTSWTGGSVSFSGQPADVHQ